MNILLGIYFIIIGAIALFGLSVDPKLIGLLALVIGVGLLVAPYTPWWRR